MIARLARERPTAEAARAVVPRRDGLAGLGGCPLAVLADLRPGIAVAALGPVDYGAQRLRVFTVDGRLDVRHCEQMLDRSRPERRYRISRTCESKRTAGGRSPAVDHIDHEANVSHRQLGSLQPRELAFLTANVEDESSLTSTPRWP